MRYTARRVIPNSPRRPEALGDYQLTRVLGTNELARLYEAHRLGPHGFEKRVALKRLRRELAGDPQWVSSLSREVQRLASLNHPNLVQIVDFEASGGELFLAVEYVDGLTVDQLVHRVAVRRRRVEPGVALLIVRELLRGLEYLHGATDDHGRPLGLVHGSVEPSHVLIGAAGQVKLGEFALRRAFEHNQPSHPGGGGLPFVPPGPRPGYGSPEQLQRRPADRKSDLFGAGIVLAELLLTRSLFGGGSEEEARAAVLTGDLSRLRTYGWHLSDDVRRILEQALAVSPHERYASASEFRADVEAALLASQGPTSGHELVEWLAGLGLIDCESGVLPVARPYDEGIGRRSSYRPSQARQYRVRGLDGAVQGPLTAATLLERIATGRLDDSVHVARGEEPFAPLRSIPELEGLASREPYRFREAPDVGIPDHPVELGSLAAHLLSLAVRRCSGLLRAEYGQEQARIYFAEGRPVFSSCTDPSFLLGAQLVTSGVVTSGAIEACLAKGWRADEPLGESLVLRGFLSRAALHSALETQLERRLTSIARLRTGRLVFLPGVRSGFPDIPSLRTGPALVARAVLQAYTAEELGRVLMPFWHQRLRPSSRAHELFEVLELEPVEGYWLQRALEGASLATLVNEAAGDRGTIASALGAVLIGLATELLLP